MDTNWPFDESDFFEGMPDEKQDFMSLADRLQVKKGGFIFVAGDSDDHCYYLEIGSVKVLGATFLGKEPIFWIRKPGELFGLAEVANGKARACSAQAVTSCSIYRIAGRHFDELLSRYHKMTRKVISVMGKRVRYLCGQIENLTASDVATKLTRLLVCLSYRQLMTTGDPHSPVKFRVDLTQAEIASMMGSCQQTISETLRKLEHDGLIEVSGKEITILNPSEVLERTYH